ncbi:unannotated protein [freshwater metagenome]|uniref:Unannotated protein n=1 Tax=freshwater metagenome TaxID=449393 RepID=A0A6J6FQR0_9ZZZZ|nr:HAD hydrolase-like protein [Actinomycetota bacterium]
MAKRGVLFFDLDGTLADSGAGIHAALNEVFSTRGHEVLTLDELHMVIGPPLEESLPLLFEPRGVGHEQVQEFILGYRSIYKAKYLPHTQFNLGMDDAFHILREHWHVAVVTAKPEPQALVAIEALGITEHMVTIVGPDGDHAHPKTLLLERAVREVSEALGTEVLVSECWMIGDRHHDIDAGLHVGTRAMGVLWGFGSHDELAGAGAHAVVANPGELVTTLMNS